MKEQDILPDEKKTEPEEFGKTDANFYAQTCDSFRYHAGQRTTTINIFIALYSAVLAFYGSIIFEHNKSRLYFGIFVGLFALLISVLFFNIDRRAEYDIKHTYDVLKAFERKYGYDKLEDEIASLGVFCDEDRRYNYYQPGFRGQLIKAQKKYKRYFSQIVK